jgi:hypothetical protein
MQKANQHAIAAIDPLFFFLYFDLSLVAVGSSQAGKKRKGPGRRTSGLELWERQERRDRAQAHSKTQATTATAPAAAPDRRGGPSEEDRDEELESHRDAAAARTLAGIAAGWPG